MMRISPEFADKNEKGVIHQLLGLAPDASIKPPAEEVGNAVANYNPYFTELTFPGVTKSQLRECDYYHFFMQLHERIQPGLPLQHLYIKPCSVDALRGLRAFLVS